MAAFETKILQPHILQFCIYEGKYGFLCLLTFALAGLDFFENTIASDLLIYFGLFLIVYLAFQLVYMLRMKYIITGEQLIYLHGVFIHSTDYMELYRVVDYQQSRTMLQQLLRLKTITILSGDRNMNKLDIIGIPENRDIVSEIRKRVEYNKKMRGIYEITNRI